MDIEYASGVRVTSLPHEMTPLEAAIDSYSRKAQQYYKEITELDNTPARSETRMAREKKLKDALAHLETERKLAEAIVDVQTQVEFYRDQGRALSKSADGRKVLHAEKHHPTKILAQQMRLNGDPKPSLKHTPHHIVPGVGKTKNANRARLHIHRYGVRINDGANGVWLVRKKSDTPHWSMPTSKSHLTIHTHNYETWIYQGVRINRSEAAVRQKLNIMGRMLQNNHQPKHVTMPPDPEWDGK